MLDLLGMVLFGWIWFPLRWIMTLIVGQASTPLQSSWRLQAGTLIGAAIGFILAGVVIFLQVRAQGQWAAAVLLFPGGMIVGALIGGVLEAIYIMRRNARRSRIAERDAKKKKRGREVHEDNLGR